MWSEEPLPAEPADSRPGAARAAAVSSSRERHGRDGFTATTFGVSISSDTGAKARGSKGKEGNSHAFTASGPSEPTSSVWPSGSDFATTSAPRLPPAPGRLSTTKGWPNTVVSRAASGRATESAKPPGGNGTTMRTGRVGQAGRSEEHTSE